MACGMAKPCKFPSLDSCQKRFLWAHKRVDLALHLVVGLVFQVVDTEKFPQALGFKGLHGSFSQSQQGGSMFHSQTPVTKSQVKSWLMVLDRRQSTVNTTKSKQSIISICMSQCLHFTYLQLTEIFPDMFFKM